jgi:hypothetical protein
MSFHNFKVGDISYSLVFKISVNKVKDNMGGFDVTEKEHKFFYSTKVFKNKNEAIDAMIEQIKELKE